MALYIKDPEVDAMAVELQRITNAPSKTEAVRRALEAAIAEREDAKPLIERIAPALALADAMGPTDPDFDMKAFTNEMWGDA